MLAVTVSGCSEETNTIKEPESIITQDVITQTPVETQAQEITYTEPEYRGVFFTIRGMVREAPLTNGLTGQVKRMITEYSPLAP